MSKRRRNEKIWGKYAGDEKRVTQAKEFTIPSI